MELLHPRVAVSPAALIETFPLFQQSAEGSSGSRKRAEERDIPTLPTSQHKRRNSQEGEF